MTEKPAPNVWPALRYDDAPAAVRFLVDVLGFTEALVVPGPEGSIAHAELRWPEGGAVMLGSTGHPADGVHDAMKPGAGAVYVVSDHVDEIHARVAATDAKITAELHDTDYGSHTFSLRDTEGNAWTIGTYRGAP
ncbi:MAG: VOC family protein [Mycobacterium sp.]|nr:VOC family protein [Mycobacterium sp.]MBV9721807.1 VOC family protein [Mycobacterium sp.]